MGFAKNIMGAGLPAAAAAADTISSVASAVSAAGTTAGTATAVSADWNDVTTCAAGAGVILYNGVIGDSCFIGSYGANAVTVYPPTSGLFNALAANTGVLIPVNSNAWFIKVTATKWRVILSA